jgi:eukaryotic-like serine/threonine-protein kinase
LSGIQTRRRYRLTRRIAIGGMAEIFLAQLRSAGGFERSVVIKKILARWHSHPDVLDLFRDEAKLGSSLHHHNIVQVLDYGSHQGDSYLVLEYVDGRNLADLMETLWADGGRYIDPETVVYVFSEVCSALEHIHSRKAPNGRSLGVIHRDLNPSNVLLSTSGEVKLTDFGVAAGGHRSQKTEHGILRGTFPYMSPEQTESQALDARSDLFSFGICLYEILTARHPFAAHEDYETIQRIQQYDPPPPSKLRREIDPALNAIVMRCLEKAPHDRYDDAGSLRDDLQAWLRARRATHGAGRLLGLMGETFPVGPHGELVEPLEISIGPTHPGRGAPMLNLSRLDDRPPAYRPGPSASSVSMPAVTAPRDPSTDDAPPGHESVFGGTGVAALEAPVGSTLPPFLASNPSSESVRTPRGGASLSRVPAIAPGHRIRRIQESQHAPWDRRDLRGKPPSGVETLEPFPGVSSASRPERGAAARVVRLGWALVLVLAAMGGILLLNLQ